MMPPLSPSNRNNILYRRSSMLSSSPVQQPKKRTFSSIVDSPKPKVAFQLQYQHTRSSSGPVSEPAPSRVRLTSEPRPQLATSASSSNSSSTTTIGTPTRIADRITKSWEALLPKAEGISPTSEMMFSTLNPFSESPSPRPTAAALPTELEYSSLQPSFDLGGFASGDVQGGLPRSRFPFSESWDSLAGGGEGSEISELATPPMSLVQLDKIAGEKGEEEEGCSFGRVELGRASSLPHKQTNEHEGDPFFFPRGRSTYPSPLLTHLSLPPPLASTQRTSSVPQISTKHHLRPPHLSLVLPSTDFLNPAALTASGEEPLPITPVDRIMTIPSCPPPLNHSPLHLGHSNPPSVEQHPPPPSAPSNKPFNLIRQNLSASMERRDSVPHLILPDEFPMDSPPLISAPVFASTNSAKSRMAALTSNNSTSSAGPKKLKKTKKPFPLTFDLAKTASFTGDDAGNSPALHSPFMPEFLMAEGAGCVGLMPKRKPMERQNSLMWGGDETLPESMRMEE